MKLAGPLVLTALPPAVVPSPPVELTATNATAPQRETTAAAHDPTRVDGSPAVNRPAPRLIQQELRNEGRQPGTPDGLVGPRPHANALQAKPARRSEVAPFHRQPTTENRSPIKTAPPRQETQDDAVSP